MRTIPIDPSAADAAELARTLRKMLERRGAGGIEVITVDQLLKRQTEPEESEPAKEKEKETEKG